MDPEFQKYHIFAANDGSVTLQRFDADSGIHETRCETLQQAFDLATDLEPQWTVTPLPQGHVFHRFDDEIHRYTLAVTPDDPTKFQVPGLAMRHGSQATLLEDGAIHIGFAKPSEPLGFLRLTDSLDRQLMIQINDRNELGWVLREMAPHYATAELCRPNLVPGTFVEGVGHEWAAGETLDRFRVDLDRELEIEIDAFVEILNQADATVEAARSASASQPETEVSLDVSEFYVTTENAYQVAAEAEGWQFQAESGNPEEPFIYRNGQRQLLTKGWRHLCLQEAIDVSPTLHCQIYGVPLEHLQDQSAADLEKRFSEALGETAFVHFEAPDLAPQALNRPALEQNPPITSVLMVDLESERHIEITPQADDFIHVEDPDAAREALRQMAADLLGSPRVDVIYPGYDDQNPNFRTTLEREAEEELSYEVGDDERMIGMFATHQEALQYAIFLSKERKERINLYYEGEPLSFFVDGTEHQIEGPDPQPEDFHQEPILEPEPAPLRR